MTDSVPETFDEARAMLRPRPIGMTPYANRRRVLDAQGAGSAVDVAHEFVADIALGAFLSLETANVPVNADHLETWGVDFRAVLDAAFQNATQERAQMDTYNKAIYVSGETFGAMILAMEGVLEQITQGRPAIVLLPTSINAVIGFIDDPESLADAADAAQQLLEQNPARSVSIVPLYRHDGVWSAVAWPDAASAAYDKLAKRFNIIQYANAREQLMEGELADEGYVANYSVMASPSGEWVSVASVAEGINNIIPPVDMVGLVRTDGASITVPLSALTARDDLVVPIDGLIPPYLRVTRFPEELFEGSDAPQ